MPAKPCARCGEKPGCTIENHKRVKLSLDSLSVSSTLVRMLVSLFLLCVGSRGEFAAVAGSSSAWQERVLEIVRFPDKSISFLEWMRSHGWEELKGSAAVFHIENKTLHMQSTAYSTTVGTKFDSVVDLREFPFLEFSVRVDEIPSGADVTDRKIDDAAFRLFLLFDKGGFLSVTPPHTIGYVWDSTLEEGETGRAALFGQVRYIVIGSGRSGLGVWKTIRRNVREDYRLLFGSDRVPKVKALGLKSDSNHTRSRSASSVGFIRFVSLSER